MKQARLFAVLSALIVLFGLLLSQPGIAEEDDDPALAEGAELRIMSYNLMHPDWTHIKVNGRDELVAAILMYYRPDVVAVQEAGAKWHKALIPLLMENGSYATACRQSNADGFLYCTTCFFYNPETVKPVEEYIWDVEMKSASRVFSVAVFERIGDGARFAVTNTHPAPRDEPKKYASNMASITAYAAEAAEKFDGLPLIIAGDFNTPEDAEAYFSLMDAAGVRDAKFEAKTLVRSYPTYFGYQVIPSPDNMDYCVDHLFVNDKIDVLLYNAVIGHDVQDASDHIPIYIDIAFK